MTEDELAAIERRHPRDQWIAHDGVSYANCAACADIAGEYAQDDWPCDAVRLLAEVRRLQAENEAWEHAAELARNDV